MAEPYENGGQGKNRWDEKMGMIYDEDQKNSRPYIGFGGRGADFDEGSYRETGAKEKEWALGKGRRKMDGPGRFWDKAAQGPRGVNVVDFDIIPSSTALTIIDMQKYGCCRDIGLGPVYPKETPETAEYRFSRPSQVAVPNIRNLLHFFRKNKLRVIHVCVGPLLPDASDMIPRRRRRDESRLKVSGIDHFFSPGTLEHEIIDELKPNPGEMIFNKNTSSAFNSTNIDQIFGLCSKST